MREHISKEKKMRVLKDLEKFKHVIKDYKFKVGDLVLVRNTAIKSSLDRKMYDRYLGPLVIVGRSRGGAYAVAELDGSLFDKKVAAFRVIPYYARKEIKLPDNLEDFLDTSQEKLEELLDSEDPVKEENTDFSFPGIKLREAIDGDEEVENNLNLGAKELNEGLENEEDSDDENDETPVSSRLRKRK